MYYYNTLYQFVNGFPVSLFYAGFHFLCLPRPGILTILLWAFSVKSYLTKAVWPFWDALWVHTLKSNMVTRYPADKSY